MAELLLKVGSNGPDPAFQDGDTVCAFNDRSILCVHAQHACHPKNFGFNSDGLRPGRLTEMFLSKVAEFKFQRVSHTEIVKTELATGEEYLIGAQLNDKGEQMDVPLFVRRRLLNPNHMMFGSIGSERWYSGEFDLSSAKVQSVWDEIENRSSKRRTDFTKWPLSDHEKRVFLPIAAEDFSDSERQRMQSEVVRELERGKEVLQARPTQVDYRSIVPDSAIARIQDISKIVDLRDEEPISLQTKLKNKRSPR